MNCVDIQVIIFFISSSMISFSAIFICDTWKKIKFKEFEMIERLEKPFSDKEMPFHSVR
jgi:hypothetical protein